MSGASPSHNQSIFANYSLSTTCLPNGNIPKTLAYAVFFLVSVVGNSLILLAIRRDNRLKTTNNFLIANMAVSDILVTVFALYLTNTIPFIEIRPWGIIHLISHFLHDSSICVSFYTCFFIAIDRYLAVARPLKGGFSKSRHKIIIPSIWVFSTLLFSPLFILREKGSTVLLHIVNALNFFFFGPAIATLYGMIIYKLRNHKAPGNPTDIAIRRRQLQNRKVHKMSITIVSLLYLSWGYFALVNIFDSEGMINQETVKRDVYFSALFLGHTTCTQNFFILLLFNGIYRGNFKSMVSKIFCKCLHSPVNPTND